MYWFPVMTRIWFRSGGRKTLERFVELEGIAWQDHRMSTSGKVSEQAAPTSAQVGDELQLCKVPLG